MSRYIAAQRSSLCCVLSCLAFAAVFFATGCKRNKLASVDSIHTGSGDDARSLVPVPVRLSDQTLGFCAYVATGTKDPNELLKIGPGQVGSAQVLTPFPVPEGEFFAGLESLDGVGGLGGGIVKSVLLGSAAVTLIAGGDYLLGGWNGIVLDGFKQTRFTTPVTSAANASSLEVVDGKLKISSLPGPAQDELRKAVSVGVDVHVAGAALRAEERAQLAEVAKSANLSDEAMPIFQKLKSAFGQIRDPEQIQVLMQSIFASNAEELTEIQSVLKRAGVDIPDEELKQLRAGMASVSQESQEKIIRSLAAIRVHQQTLENMVGQIRKYSEDIVDPFRGRFGPESGLKAMNRVVEKSASLFDGIGQGLAQMMDDFSTSENGLASSSTARKLFSAINGQAPEKSAAVVQRIGKFKSLESIAVADRRAILRGIAEAPGATKNWAENGLKRISAFCVGDAGVWVRAGCGVAFGAAAIVGVSTTWNAFTSGAQQKAVQSNLAKPASDQMPVSSTDFMVVTNAIKAMRGEEFDQSCQ